MYMYVCIYIYIYINVYIYVCVYVYVYVYVYVHVYVHVYVYAKIEQYFKYTDRPTQARYCDEIMFERAFRDLSALELIKCVFSFIIMCSVCYPACTCVKKQLSNISSIQTGPHKLALVMVTCLNTHSETS
jgi:hypothetical protein